jgi:hypothetical protein
MDTFIGVILIIGGLAMLMFGIYFVFRSVKSLGWLRTKGTVVSSKVVHTVHGRSNSYTPTVEYTYHAENREYKGSIIGIGLVGTLPWLAKNKVMQYPEGSGVYVYYDQHDPSDAVLETGFKSGTFILLAVCILLIAVGIAQLLSLFLHINI